MKDLNLKKRKKKKKSRFKTVMKKKINTYVNHFFLPPLVDIQCTTAVETQKKSSGIHPNLILNICQYILSWGFNWNLSCLRRRHCILSRRLTGLFFKMKHRSVFVVFMLYTAEQPSVWNFTQRRLCQQRSTLSKCQQIHLQSNMASCLTSCCGQIGHVFSCSLYGCQVFIFSLFLPWNDYYSFKKSSCLSTNSLRRNVILRHELWLWGSCDEVVISVWVMSPHFLCFSFYCHIIVPETRTFGCSVLESHSWPLLRKCSVMLLNLFDL